MAEIKLTDTQTLIIRRLTISDNHTAWYTELIHSPNHASFKKLDTLGLIEHVTAGGQKVRLTDAGRAFAIEQGWIVVEPTAPTDDKQLTVWWRRGGWGVDPETEIKVSTPEEAVAELKRLATKDLANDSVEWNAGGLLDVDGYEWCSLTGETEGMDIREYEDWLDEQREEARQVIISELEAIVEQDETPTVQNLAADDASSSAKPTHSFNVGDTVYSEDDDEYGVVSSISEFRAMVTLPDYDKDAFSGTFSGKRDIAELQWVSPILNAEQRPIDASTPAASVDAGNGERAFEVGDVVILDNGAFAKVTRIDEPILDEATVQVWETENTKEFIEGETGWYARYYTRQLAHTTSEPSAAHTSAQEAGTGDVSQVVVDADYYHADYVEGLMNEHMAQQLASVPEDALYTINAQAKEIAQLTSERDSLRAALEVARKTLSDLKYGNLRPYEIAFAIQDALETIERHNNEGSTID